VGCDQEKSQDFAYCILAYCKKHIHFYGWPWGKKTPVRVDLLYYDNLKPAGDIVLTQELQTYALPDCLIRD